MTSFHLLRSEALRDCGTRVLTPPFRKVPKIFGDRRADGTVFVPSVRTHGIGLTGGRSVARPKPKNRKVDGVFHLVLIKILDSALSDLPSCCELKQVCCVLAGRGGLRPAD